MPPMTRHRSVNGTPGGNVSVQRWPTIPVRVAAERKSDGPAGSMGTTVNWPPVFGRRQTVGVRRADRFGSSFFFFMG